jgi:hypothetical protein
MGIRPSSPARARKQLASALEAAGILFTYRPDRRLEGVAAYEQYRFEINGPDCVLFIGTKPAWSLGAWYRVERAHIAFYAQQPLWSGISEEAHANGRRSAVKGGASDANKVMAWSAAIYGLLVISVPTSLFALSFWHSAARRFMARSCE